MKKTITIALILCLSLPFVGIHIYRSLKINQIESEFIRQHESGQINKNLVVFNFSRNQINNDLNWTSKREFIFNNKVYKLIKLKYIDKNTVFYCWENIDKANLYNRIVDYFSMTTENQSQNRDVQSFIISFIKGLYFLESFYEINLFAKYINLQNQFFDFYNSLGLSIPNPPPKY